jgi:hypothetical protein
MGGTKSSRCRSSGPLTEASARSVQWTRRLVSEPRPRPRSLPSRSGCRLLKPGATGGVTSCPRDSADGVPRSPQPTRASGSRSILPSLTSFSLDERTDVALRNPCFWPRVRRHRSRLIRGYIGRSDDACLRNNRAQQPRSRGREAEHSLKRISGRGLLQRMVWRSGCADSDPSWFGLVRLVNLLHRTRTTHIILIVWAMSSIDVTAFLKRLHGR